MLKRIEVSLSTCGLLLPDPFDRGNTMFEVLSVGPGRWLFHTRTKRKVFISPEVIPGETVFSTHWFTASVHPKWHQPEFLDNVDGRGRVILDARFCILSYGKIEPKKFVSSSHL